MVRSVVNVATYSKIRTGYNFRNIRRVKNTTKRLFLSCQMSQFYSTYIFDPRHGHLRCPVYDYGWTVSLTWPFFLLSINVQDIDRQIDRQTTNPQTMKGIATIQHENFPRSSQSFQRKLKLQITSKKAEQQ